MNLKKNVELGCFCIHFSRIVKNYDYEFHSGPWKISKKSEVLQPVCVREIVGCRKENRSKIKEHNELL